MIKENKIHCPSLLFFDISDPTTASQNEIKLKRIKKIENSRYCSVRF